jgi:ABC-type multidrug transport system fused ATPase/permease subunit
MFLVGIISWWYGDGWRARFGLMKERLAVTADFFSIGLLSRTLFSPFRQISADKVNGSMTVQLQAVFDKLISRLVGAIARLMLMVVGAIVLLIQLLWSAVVIVFWLLVPIFPIVGIIAAILGVSVSWN